MAEHDEIDNSTLSSTRAGRAVSLLPSYLTDARAVTKYCRSTAPDGALQLSVAENQMLEDLLVPALTEFTRSREAFPADAIYYQPTHGREPLRRAVTQYLEDLLDLDDGEDNSNNNLDPEGIVVGAGCNAVLENLCVSLAEPGQGVMIPLPYYAAFEFDLGSRAGLEVVPVPTMGYSGISSDDSVSPPCEAYYLTRAALDAAKNKSMNEHGVEPRILLISHPQNPLGICYPPHVIKETIDWCRENKIHLISDEIYAGSIYRKDSADFSSALKIASSPSSSLSSSEKGLGLGPYVHLVYALSKDFALSGLRVGVMYSENQEIRLPVQKLNDLCSVSSQTQILVEDLLMAKSSSSSSLSWTNEFLSENQRRIRQRCDTWQSCLNELNIPHLDGTAGLFCWMDFSEFLPDEGTPDERERKLYLELLNDYGLLFTPGQSMKSELPGFFRCVFTAASDHEFDLGMERLKAYVKKKKGIE